MKLTRKQIKESLEQIPVDRLLLGGAAHGVSLTKKQKAFAEEVVKTGNKTAAYRKAYDTHGKPATQSRDAQKIANNPKVSTYIEALEAAEEARKYLIPARLRDLAIHKITEKALDPAVPPAQQLKALELLGKITEVSLFTHRTETVHLTSSTEIKDQLMKTLRLAMSNGDITDVEANPVDDLLAEIAEGKRDPVAAIDPEPVDPVAVTGDTLDDDPQTHSQIPEAATPLHPDPLNQPMPPAPSLHSIPRNRFDAKSAVTHKNLSVEPVTTGVSGQGVTGVTPSQGKPLDEGEGV